MFLLFFSDFTFGKSLVWDIENELPEELIETSLHPDLPPSSQSSTSQNLSSQNIFNGTIETVPVEGSVAPQRHQQLSQLLQAKPTQQGHTGLPASQRIPSPSVTSIISAKSPLTNNASVNKSGIPVSSTVHINASDGSIAISNISNNTVNSLSNTSGTMGMNSNMLLMQSKSGTLGSQGSLVSLSSSVVGNNNANNLQHPVSVAPPQLTQQQNAGSLINGNVMSFGNTSSLGINRGVNSNVPSAALVQNSSHENVLGHISNQGANLKVCSLFQ